MKKDFIKMLIDLMLLDEENAKELLNQFVDIYGIDTTSAEFKRLKKYVENYER